MFNKFDNEAQRVLLNSKEESRKLKHKYISTEHFVLSLLSFDNKISKILKNYKVNYDNFRIDFNMLDWSFHWRSNSSNFG